MADQDLMLALRDLVMAAERERLRMAREVLNIGLNELLSCTFIAVSGPRTPSEIADRLQITTASVTELVDRLERGGLVTRIPHPTDRRKVLVTLTATGQHKSELLQQRFAEALSTCSTNLTPSERATVLDFLRRAAVMMGSPPWADTPR